MIRTRLIEDSDWVTLPLCLDQIDPIPFHYTRRSSSTCINSTIRRNCRNAKVTPRSCQGERSGPFALPRLAPSLSNAINLAIDENAKFEDETS